MRFAISALLTIVLASRLSAQKAADPAGEWKTLDLSLSQRSMKSIHPRNGFVPDAATAVRIAEAVAVAQWGEKVISEELPFKGRLRNDVWTVKGTLHPQGAAGGTGVVQISKATGAILFAVHRY